MRTIRSAVYSVICSAMLLLAVINFLGCVVEKEKPTADDYGFGNDFGRAPVEVQGDVNKPKPKKKPFKLW